MYRHVFLGPTNSTTEAFSDLSFRERAYLVPLVIGLLLFGLYPKPLLDLVRPTALTLLSTIK
jgi:NADH-quinone oxidoreductase subunit M